MKVFLCLLALAAVAVAVEVVPAGSDAAPRRIMYDLRSVPNSAAVAQALAAHGATILSADELPVKRAARVVGTKVQGFLEGISAYGNMYNGNTGDYIKTLIKGVVSQKPGPKVPVAKVPVLKV